MRTPVAQANRAVVSAPTCAGVAAPAAIAVSHHGLPRWEGPSVRTSLRTIRVRILDPYGNGGDDTDRARVIAALDRWEETGIPLHFSVIDGPADSVRDADITVCWVRQFSRSYNGWTTLATDRGQIRRAAVVLALNDPHGDALSDAVRSAVAMHEMGHAIGLRHATDSTALMWPVAGARDGLSPSDVEAVRRLYFPVQQRERVAAASHASP